MSNVLDFHKEILFTKKYNEDQPTPYINISNLKSESSNNLQVESSHFSLKSNNNKNSTSLNNNQQILNNNLFVSSTSGILSFSKSIINSNRINNIDNSLSAQIPSENRSLSDSNRFQNSLNSNQIIKSSFFYSPSTLCNYYQKSNDVTPYKSPLKKDKKEQSNTKKLQKLKQKNKDIINKNNQKEDNKENNDNSNYNKEEIISRSEECSLDCKKSLSSHRKYVLEKKTPIKYAKNQLQSGDRSQKSLNNSSPFPLNEGCNNIDNLKSETSKGRETRNGRNLMDAFEKIGNNNENLTIFNNRRQPTEIHLISPELIEKKKSISKENNSNFIEKLQKDNIFLTRKNIKAGTKEEKINNNNYLPKIKNIPKNDEKFSKKEWKKIVIRKIIPITKKEYNANTSKLSKKIISELSKSNIRNRKENILKIRPSSFTKNIIININSFNSINNSNIYNKNNKKIQNQKKIFKQKSSNFENCNNRSDSFTKFTETNTNLFLGSTAKYIINKKINNKTKKKIPLILNLFSEKEKSKKNKLIPIVNSKRDNNSFIINELKELTNNCDKNYQTFSAWTTVEKNVKLKLKLNEKKNLINDIRERNNNNIIHPILNKEEPKLNVIQNFSSYHKIKTQNVNFAETQPKCCSKNNNGFYKNNSNNIKINICNFRK